MSFYTRWFITLFFIFFFNDTATTEIYTLSLHDALPIWSFRRSTTNISATGKTISWSRISGAASLTFPTKRDRKSTRLNSSHSQISYAVFCLKQKNTAEGVIHSVLRIHDC